MGVRLRLERWVLTSSEVLHERRLFTERTILFNPQHGNAAAAGVTLTAPVNLVDGVAIGAATASGATLTVATSLFDGIAMGDLPVALSHGGGSQHFRIRRYRDLDEEQDAVAPSAILTCRTVLIAGVARVSAKAHGVQLDSCVQILPGTAKGFDAFAYYDNDFMIAA